MLASTEIIVTQIGAPLLSCRHAPRKKALVTNLVWLTHDELEPHEFEQVVAFASDHGYRLGEQLQWGKGSAFEAPLRIPLMISAPSIAHRSGAAITAPIEAVIGLLPTLTQLAGLDMRSLPSDIRGRSLVPLILDDELAVKGFGCAVRSDTNYAHSIAVHFNDGRTFRYTEPRFALDDIGMWYELYDVTGSVDGAHWGVEQVRSSKFEVGCLLMLMCLLASLLKL